MTVAEHERLRAALPAGWELRACAGAVERLRAVKDAAEVERMRAAAQLADEALRGLLEDGLVGRSEREVALDLELRMRRLGAEAPSFPSIVAAGAHGALPHAEPRDEPIARDVLVTIDWGALLRGLLLGLHAHLRHRRGHLRAGARDLCAGARRAGTRPRGRARPARPGARSTRWPAR